MGSKEQRDKYYDEAIRLHYEKKIGALKISRIIPVERTTIDRWIRKFAMENNVSRYSSYEMVKSKLPKEPVVEQITGDEIKALKAENLKLQRQLREAELRADLYNEIIEVAEEKFNLPIKKKAGAKQ